MALVLAAAAGDAAFATGAWLLGWNQRKAYEKAAEVQLGAMQIQADLAHKQMDLWDRAQQREFDERERERKRAEVLEMERMHMFDRERTRQFDDRERERQRERERAEEDRQRLREERARDREEWDREEKREELLATRRAREALGPIAGLLFLLEKHQRLVFTLVAFFIFERVVTKLIDVSFGYSQLTFGVLILVSLHFTLRPFAYRADLSQSY